MDSGGISTPEALREALELKIASLEDQVDADVELTQMGMARRDKSRIRAFHQGYPREST
jgi:hypothetical protein